MSRNRPAKSYFKQVAFQTTLLNYRIFQRNQRKITIKPALDKTAFAIQKLTQLHEIDELLAFSKQFFIGQNQYIAQRIQELLTLCAEDDAMVVSADSLKSMLLFLMKLQKINPVDITVSENGLWHLDWEKTDIHSMTLRFRADNCLDYAIFLPSQHVDKPIILSGSINIFDFIEQLVIKNDLIYQLIYK